jgi:hypothetical protein
MAPPTCVAEHFVHTSVSGEAPSTSKTSIHAELPRFHSAGLELAGDVPGFRAMT